MLLFKNESLEQDFEKIDTRLKVLLYIIAGLIAHRFAKDFTVTSLLRDDHSSVHHYGRGADAFTENLTKEEGDEVVEFINSKFFMVMKVSRPYLMNGKNVAPTGQARIFISRLIHS